MFCTLMNAYRILVFKYGSHALSNDLYFNKFFNQCIFCMCEAVCKLHSALFRIVAGSGILLAFWFSLYFTVSDASVYFILLVVHSNLSDKILSSPCHV
jgi:hypothetical protein